MRRPNHRGENGRKNDPRTAREKREKLFAVNEAVLLPKYGRALASTQLAMGSGVLRQRNYNKTGGVSRFAGTYLYLSSVSSLLPSSSRCLEGAFPAGQRVCSHSRGRWIDR